MTGAQDTPSLRSIDLTARVVVGRQRDSSGQISQHLQMMSCGAGLELRHHRHSPVRRRCSIHSLLLPHTLPQEYGFDCQGGCWKTEGRLRPDKSASADGAGLELRYHERIPVIDIAFTN